MLNELENFTLQTARPFPVIILADVSGSMAEDGKIDILNNVIPDMLKDFSQASSNRVEIHVAVIVFGGEDAWLHQDLMPAKLIQWVPMKAKGCTPLGRAFDLARSLVEDKQKIPSRSYAPAIILASDARPTDTSSDDERKTWRNSLNELLRSERAAKSARYALAIGEDADMEVLKAFLHDQNKCIYSATDVEQIKLFFRYVTMSETTRSRSENPDLIPPTENSEDDFSY